MPARKQNNRGRIGKANTRGAANGISIRGASSRAPANRGGRPPLGPRTGLRELLPNFAKERIPPPRNPHHAPGPINHSQDTRSRPTQQEQPKAAVEVPAPPKVERIFNGIWESGPASFAFATHGNLDHNEDTITLALNILDHIIRPENWNPELSNNKLSASCFFFASKLTDRKVTAMQVAGSIWVHPSMVADMSQAQEGPLYDRMLESLTVSAEQVVQGYAILYEQKDSLKDLLGEYGESIAMLPLPATEIQLLESESEEEPSQVAAEMMKMGYQRGLGRSVESTVDIGKDKGLEVLTTSQDVEAENAASIEDLAEEGVWNNDFEDFVAENE